MKSPARLTASERVLRMLAIVPWVAARPDGVTIDELCARFDIAPATLLADLETVSMVGVAPFTPDTQVDVVVEDGRVFVHLPQWFDRPLRLTPEQGLALVVAAQSMLAIQGADPDGPLARGIRKIASTLGIDPGEHVDVQLGHAAADVVTTVQAAIAARRSLAIDYYVYGRDEHTSRTVDPHRLFSDEGNLYLLAHCHEVDDGRIFRVDRIERAAMLDATFEESLEAGDRAVFRAAAHDPRVVLDLAERARWVAEQYPTEAVEELAGNGLRITLAVTATPWLERLLLRLGPDAVVVDAPMELARCAPAAAARILSRYASA